MKALVTTTDNSLSKQLIIKVATLFTLLTLVFTLNSFAQQATILKINVSPMFTGEYGATLEHKLGKRASIYGEASYLNKDNSTVIGQGFGTKAGLRYYFNIKRSYKKGRNKSKMKAFAGHFISAEGRYGQLVPASESFDLQLSRQYSKFAIHYGAQKFWKNFFINAEVGPSWGTSDFADTGSKGYYTDGFNLDGRFAIGLAF